MECRYSESVQPTYQPYVRIRVNTNLMREVFTTFYEENCYAVENLRKILYVYVKKYLRHNNEIEELQKAANKAENSNDFYFLTLYRTLEFVKNASMQNFFSQIADIKIPANFLVKNGKIPIGMKEKRSFISVRFRYDLHKMKSFAYGLMFISRAAVELEVHNFYEHEHEYHMEIFYDSGDEEFFRKTYDMTSINRKAKEAFIERKKCEDIEERMIKSTDIFRDA